MLDAVRHGASTVHILSDDTDVFVIMVYWCWKAGITTNLQMEKWNGTVLSINTTAKNLGDHCCSILAMHALSGCDTTSYSDGKGKVSAPKAMRVVLYWRGRSQRFTEYARSWKTCPPTGALMESSRPG